MTALGPGSTHEQRSISHPQYLSTADPGRGGGGTYNTLNANNTGGDSTEYMLQQYENIFGPAARDIKFDSQRDKRRQRWHLPDVLKGPNDFLTTRVDGLITDATKSLFTGFILPYKEKTDPDAKFKWNVYLFDEGLASRVPYESAARVLPQSKRSFAGYVVRQGLAIAMEHNFLASAAGRENFKNQLQQLVGSVQLTNDLDVHTALLLAPSYQKQMDEKFYDQHKTVAKTAREYVDLFGIMQKIPNALDFLIEDAKNHMQTWGSKNPNFLLCNGSLTAQLTMLPEVTNFVTNGAAGPAKLAAGPELATYRGLRIINTRKFSMESGTAPRDLLRRRVRVAEYYRIPWHEDNPRRSYEFYDQSRDTMFRLSWQELVEMAKFSNDDDSNSAESYDTTFWQTGKPLSDEKMFFEPMQNNGAPPWAPLYTLIRRQNGQDRTYQIWDHQGKNVLKVPTRLVSKVYPWRKVRPDNVLVENLTPAANSVQQCQAMLSDVGKNLHVFTEVYGSGLFSDYFEGADARKSMEGNMWNYMNWNQLHPQTYRPIVQGNITYQVPIADRNFIVNPQVLLAANTGDLRMSEFYKNAGAMFDKLCDNVLVVQKLQSCLLGRESAQFCEGVTQPYNDIARQEVFVQLFGDTNFDMLNAYMMHTAGGLNDFVALVGQTPLQQNMWQRLTAFDQKMAYFSNAACAKVALQNGIDFNVDWDCPVKQMLGEITHRGTPAVVCAVWAVKLYVTAMRALVFDCQRGNASFASINFASIKYGIRAFCLQRAKSFAPDATVANPVVNAGLDNLQFGAMTRMFIIAKTHCEALLNTPSPNFMLSDLNVHHKNPVNHILQPNMHIDRYRPVEKNDARTSATSVEPNVWMLQSMLAVHYLDTNTCSALLKTCDYASPEIGNQVMEFVLHKAYANGDVEPVARANWWDCAQATDTQWMYKSKLMALFVSYFHPTQSVRDKAEETLQLSKAKKQALQSKIAQAMQSNSKKHDELNAALIELLQDEIGETDENCQFSTDVASNYFPAYHRQGNLLQMHGDVDMVAVPSVLEDVPGTLTSAGKFLHRGVGKQDCLQYCSVANVQQCLQNAWYNEDLQAQVQDAAEWVQYHGDADEILKHFVLILMKRFFKPACRFMWNGTGMPICVQSSGAAQSNYGDPPHPDGTRYHYFGEHLLHGPCLPTCEDAACVPGGPQDLLLMRPNIEHEMLGIIMGRGGDGELGCTFWGQTELSCYDDAQHGIWGMSYKYHERAIVLNERNLVRVFDVAFDGYNGGLDQTVLDWSSTEQCTEFGRKTLDRSLPYTGKSMLVMSMPYDHKRSRRPWPNPIALQEDMSCITNLTPESGRHPNDLQEHAVFSSRNTLYCSAAQQQKIKEYFKKIDFEFLQTPDAASRPAGEQCVNGETSSQMMAFEGTMKVYDGNGTCVEAIQGSGHLGPSYVGVASVREGRGVQNPQAAPTLHRLI